MQSIPRPTGQTWVKYSNYQLKSLKSLFRGQPSAIKKLLTHPDIAPFINDLVIVPSAEATRAKYNLFPQRSPGEVRAHDTQPYYSHFIACWDSGGMLDHKRLLHFARSFGIPRLSVAGGLESTLQQTSLFQPKLGDGGLARDTERIKQIIRIETELAFHLGYPELSFASTLKIWRDELAYCLNLHDLLRNKKTAEITALVHGYGSVAELSKWQTACGYDPYSGRSEQTYKIAWRIFFMRMAGHIDRIAPRPVKVKPYDPYDSQLMPEYRVPDLLAAMWLQFYLDITSDGVKFKTCKYCGNMFPTKFAKREFCPPDEWGVGVSRCKHNWDRQQTLRKQKATEPPVASN